MLAGIIILMIGILYFLDLLIPAFVLDYYILLPLILIVCSSYFIIKKGKFNFTNTLALFIGFWWFLISIEVIPESIKEYFWPLLLILVGLAIVFGSLGFAGKVKKILQKETDREGMLNYNGIFGGVKEKVVNDDFKGSNIYSVFGGCEVDFSDIQMKNDSAIINIYSVFGGSVVYLPKGFNIVYNSTAIFGGDDDKSQGDSKAKKTIYINSISIFGGCELK